MEPTSIIPILEQRLEAYQQIDDITFKLYDQLRYKDDVYVQEQQGEIDITFVDDPDTDPITESDLDYLNPTSIVTEELYERRGDPLLHYTVTLDEPTDLIWQLNTIHQLLCRPYSPIFPQLNYYDNSSIFVEVTRTIPEASPSRGIPVPEEIKRHILSYCTYQQGSEAHCALNPDIQYLNQEAHNLDAYWDLQQFMDTLEQRKRVRDALPDNIYRIQQRLFDFPLVVLNLEHRRGQYRTTFEIKSVTPLTDQDISNIFEVPATINEQNSDSYIGVLDSLDLPEHLNQVAQLMSPGFDRIVKSHRYVLSTYNEESVIELDYTVWANATSYDLHIATSQRHSVRHGFSGSSGG